MKIELSSSGFQEGGAIPKKYTCDGENVSPPLAWTGVPAETKSLAIIADDPDAPAKTWVHWVLYELDPELSGLPEGVGPSGSPGGVGIAGINDSKQTGYSGPCPPKGSPHRYYFKLYALDTALGLKPGASKKEVENRMQGHILAQGQLMGTYGR